MIKLLLVEDDESLAYIEKTGLEEQYRKEDTDEALNRIENIQEFRGSIREFAQMGEEPTLEAYLENVSLVTDLMSQVSTRWSRRMWLQAV